jgi:hypothetical protein
MPHFPDDDLPPSPPRQPLPQAPLHDGETRRQRPLRRQPGGLLRPPTTRHVLDELELRELHEEERRRVEHDAAVDAGREPPRSGPRVVAPGLSQLGQGRHRFFGGAELPPPRLRYQPDPNEAPGDRWEDMHEVEPLQQLESTTTSRFVFSFFPTALLLPS